MRVPIKAKLKTDVVWQNGGISSRIDQSELVPFDHPSFQHDWQHWTQCGRRTGKNTYAGTSMPLHDHRLLPLRRH